jgi:type I restriction enzyme, S subunit
MRLINGRAYSQHELLDEGTPIIRIQNLNGGDRWYYSNLALSEDKYCSRGDLLFAWSASFGPYIWSGDRSIYHYHIWRIVPFENIDKQFAFHLLEWITERVKAASHGVAMLHMTKAGMEAWEIPLPPLEEQRRIAAILDQAETLRTQRRQALAQLDTLTQSLFLDMFGDPVANPQRFDVVSLGDICDVRDGTHDSPKYVGEGYPLVTSKNLSSGQVDLSNVNFISAADYEAINRRSKVDRGDLVMPMIGTIGNPVLIDHEPRYAVKNVAIVKFPEGSPSNIFIRAILSGRYFDFVVAQKNRGGTQKFVSLGDLRSFPIPLPPPALQQTFATRIQAIEALKATHRAALAQLDALFASLQQRAFAGAL